MNIEQIKEALSYLRTARIPGTERVGIPAMIWGPPGLGKSEGVAQFAASIEADLVDERMSTTESVDWRGMARDTEHGVQWSRPDTFTRLWHAHENGRPSILFLDEANVGVTPSLFAIMLQLTLDERVGPHKLPPTTYTCAAGNRPGESQGAQPLPEANGNRLAHLHAEFHLDTWASWALDAGVDPRVLAFAKFREALLSGAAKDESATAPQRGVQRREHKTAFLTPRSLTRLSPILQAPAPLIPSLAASIIGDAESAEFCAFVGAWRQFPTYAQIIADPTGASIPDESNASIMFALATMLQKRVDRATIGAAFAYLRRLPRDWQSFIVVSATRRESSLKETRAVIDWLIDNQEVALA